MKLCNECGQSLEPTVVHKHQIEFLHPHNIGIDIKGNFHRGLMIGWILGFTSALVMVVK